MTQPTRRAILGAIACTPALAVSCPPQPAAARISSGLAALMAKSTSENSRLRSSADQIQAQLDDMKAAERRELDAVQHYRTQSSYATARGQRSLSTEDPSALSIAEALRRDGIQWQDDDVLRTANELVELADKRAAEIAEINERYHNPDLVERADTEYEAAHEALYPVIEYRSTCLADIAAKLDWLETHDLGEWAQDEINADIRRLAKEG